MILANFKIQYLIFLVPVFVFILFLFWKKFNKDKDFNQTYLAKQRNYNYKYGIYLLQIISLLLSFIFLVVSVFRPMGGDKKIKTEAFGVDIVFTLDVSQSMNAVDLKIANNELDRLTMAKEMIKNFVEDNSQNRYALVIFAGEAFVSVPLTLDHSAYLTFLEGIDSADVALQGTDLEKALIASIDRFSSQEDKERAKAIVLISDGGDDAEQDFSDFAKVAKEMSVSIFTLGIGDKKEVPILVGRDFFGKANYKTYNGEVVKTKLNEESLKEIAKQTKGEYFWVKEKDDFKKILDKLNNLKSSSISFSQENNSQKEDYYQVTLFFSLLFFVNFLLIRNFIKK